MRRDSPIRLQTSRTCLSPQASPNHALVQPALTSLIPKILLLVKQIRPRAAQINNLGAPIPILLCARTLKAVECIRDTLATADDAFVLVVPETAFVADACEGGGSYVAVADGAFAVAFVAEASDADAGLFAAHY